MKRGIISSIVFIILISIATAQADTEDIYSDIEDVKLEANPGLTPDSNFYALDLFLEGLLVGDNPERALQFKEEKIAEIKAMVEQGKIEEAKEIFDSVNRYSGILEKEVSPEIEKRTRESSKAVKEIFDEIEDELNEEEFEKLKELIEEHRETEDRIALAAKISTQIKGLCEKLAELDPLEYSRICKTNEDDPGWQKDLDRKLTQEQKQEAEGFFRIMSECFQNPKECRCDDIKVSSFADQCNIIAPLAAACNEGNEDACKQMEEIEDPIDLLPDYLQDVMEIVERRYGESKIELHVPEECRKEGAFDRKSCEIVMFKIHAPEECVQALEEGKISLENEREARKACEKIMFETNAPSECVEAGLTTPEECGRLMFKQHAPEECIKAGLTGDSREDERKCREIMRSLEPERREGPPVFIANCREIKDSVERLKCYDDALQGAEPYIERRGPQGGWPEPCARENAFTRESCEAVMRSFAERGRGEFEEGRPELPEEFFPRPIECPEGQFIMCADGNCRCVDELESHPERFPEEFSEAQPELEEILPPEESLTEEHPEEGSPEQIQPEQSQEESHSETESTTGDVTTGAVIIDNKFLKYYYKK